MPSPRILIVGGSTRAAADSVRRAGCQPLCADLFADLDLRQTAEVISVRSYPDSLPDDVAHVSADGWFYCGALENRPEIVERLRDPNASYGPLLGTDPQALRRVRDPLWLYDTLRSHGFAVLEVAREASPPPADGTWLQKPIASAGGRSIRVWDSQATRLDFHESSYFQRRAEGIALSAVFRTECGALEWLGASRELPGISDSDAPSTFAYCGSSGPLAGVPVGESRQPVHATLQSPAIATHLPIERKANDFHGDHALSDLPRRSSIGDQLTAIARILIDALHGLSGLVGLDFRWDGRQVWLTEVNPRYTASVEILELTSGRSFAVPSWLCKSTGTVRHVGNQQHGVAPQVMSKQILYARRRLQAPDLSRFLCTDDAWQIPIVADIPVPGTIIEPGWPICTVFAAGMSGDVVESMLWERVNSLKLLIEN